MSVTTYKYVINLLLLAHSDRLSLSNYIQLDLSDSEKRFIENINGPLVTAKTKIITSPYVDSC